MTKRAHTEQTHNVGAGYPTAGLRPKTRAVQEKKCYFEQDMMTCVGAGYPTAGLRPNTQALQAIAAVLPLGSVIVFVTSDHTCDKQLRQVRNDDVRSRTASKTRVHSKKSV